MFSFLVVFSFLLPLIPFLSCQNEGAGLRGGDVTAQVREKSSLAGNTGNVIVLPSK